MTGGVDMLEARPGAEREARAFPTLPCCCRTHRQLELVEKCLRHDDIPCVVSGREDYLEDSGVRGMLAFLHMLQVPADGAALETALRLLWDCPADLVEKVRPTCQMQTVFDPELFREIVRGYGVLEAWLGSGPDLASSVGSGASTRSGGAVVGDVRALTGFGSAAECRGFP